MKKVSFNVVPHLPYLQIGVKEIAVGKNHNLNFHNHPLHEVAIILSSSQTVHWAEGHNTPVVRGDVLLLHPGQGHAYENVDDFSVLNFLYDASNLPLPQLDGINLPIYQEIFSLHDKRHDPSQPITRLDEESIIELQQMSTPLIEELKKSSPGYNLRVFGLFIAAMVTICRSGNFNNIKVADNSALPALHYINLHFKEKISISKLLAVTKLSRNTLFRKFRELTGYTPIDYQLNKKLDAARELLKTSSMTTGEIAFNCGFCDSNHLIRLFSEKYGVTPGKIRRETE